MLILLEVNIGTGHRATIELDSVACVVSTPDGNVSQNVAIDPSTLFNEGVELVVLGRKLHSKGSIGCNADTVARYRSPLALPSLSSATKMSQGLLRASLVVRAGCWSGRTDPPRT